MTRALSACLLLLLAVPAAPGCKANMGEPWGTKRTERWVFMGWDCRPAWPLEKPHNHNNFVAI